MITPPESVNATDVAAHYDDLDLFYRDTWGRHVHHGYWEDGNETPEEAAAHLTRIVAALLNVSEEGASIVDIGSGYGETSWHLATNHRVHVTGYNLSEVQSSSAESHTPLSPETPVPNFILGDWLDNDLPDNSQDGALSIECISHIEDKRRFFTEVHRTLKPGGRLVLCAWLAKEGASPWAKRHLLQPICRDGRFSGLATMLDYRELVIHSGLELVEATDIAPRVSKTWTVIFQRLVKKTLTDKRYLRFLLNTIDTNAPLLFTIPRLILAYRTQSLGYLLLVAKKPK